MNRLLLAASFALLTVTQIGARPISAAAAADDIVVYNAQHESLAKAWVEGFTRDTGIRVIVRNGSDSELGNQLIQEDDGSPADAPTPPTNAATGPGPPSMLESRASRSS